MDDASLKELWHQLQGTPTGPGAMGTSAAPSTYGEAGQRRGKQAMKQVIQLTPHALREYVRAEARAAAAKVAAPDRARRVVEFCEQMVEQGKLSPAQVE